MTGEEAYKALNPRHRAVVDLAVSPDVTLAEAYERVYGCARKSARAAASRLLTHANFCCALEWRKRKAVEPMMGEATLTLGRILDRVAEVVSAPVGTKVEVTEGKLSTVSLGLLHKYVETGLKYFASPLAPGQGREGEVRREKLLPASLSREDADELFAKAREAGALPGLARPEDNDESVLVVEPKKKDDKAPVLQHPALMAAGGGR